ncbi:MAG: ankyrin repeat domain-containing protein, partial [Pseudomonadota bacterium]
MLYNSVISNEIVRTNEALNNRAEINHMHPIGATVLYMAVEYGFYEIAKLLLENNADPNIKAINGATPLYRAVEKNDYNMSKLLLDNNADIEISISTGSTPLYLAAHYGFSELVNLLLSHGAKKDITVFAKDVAMTAGYTRHQEGFEAVIEKTKYQFNKAGVNEVALIEMVKNEADIIFENLVWHFVTGFRKFIIVDNMSTDGTKEKIQEFAKLTKNHAKVFIIEDPLVEYIQSRVTTGSYDFARSIWPEVKWIFPADADEFWIAKKPLSEAISSIPGDIDYIKSLNIRYRASEDYFSFSNETKFYGKLHYRAYYEPSNLAKIAAKSQNCVLITQGNHYINEKPDCAVNKIFKEANSNDFGLTTYEFPIRSPYQAHNKYFQGAQANIKAKELGLKI